jgi:hypothetical protein
LHAGDHLDGRVHDRRQGLLWVVLFLQGPGELTEFDRQLIFTNRREPVSCAEGSLRACAGASFT